MMDDGTVAHHCLGAPPPSQGHDPLPREATAIKLDNKVDNDHNNDTNFHQTSGSCQHAKQSAKDMLLSHMGHLQSKLEPGELNQLQQAITALQQTVAILHTNTSTEQKDLASSESRHPGPSESFHNRISSREAYLHRGSLPLPRSLPTIPSNLITLGGNIASSPGSFFPSSGSFSQEKLTDQASLDELLVSSQVQAQTEALKRKVLISEKFRDISTDIEPSKKSHFAAMKQCLDRHCISITNQPSNDIVPQLASQAQQQIAKRGQKRKATPNEATQTQNGLSPRATKKDPINYQNRIPPVANSAKAQKKAKEIEFVPSVAHFILLYGAEERGKQGCAMPVDSSTREGRGGRVATVAARKRDQSSTFTSNNSIRRQGSINNLRNSNNKKKKKKATTDQTSMHYSTNTLSLCISSAGC